MLALTQGAVPTVRSVDAELSKRHGAHAIADFAAVTFEERGEHSLKGVSEPHRLFAVRAHQRRQLAVSSGPASYLVPRA